MAYQRGDLISATDFNTFLTTVNNVYGIGSGNRGYGQTAISQAAVTTGATITSAHWTALRNMVNTCATHQGTATTLLPGTAPLAQGQTITAHESSAPSNNAFDLNTVVAAIDTNRLTASAGNMTLTAGALVATRSSAWGAGSGAGSGLRWIIDSVWVSENTARYFFNSGGSIRFTTSHPNTSTTQNTNWNSILSSVVGTITFGATATSRSGSGGTPAGSIGFYNLTDIDQTIYDGTNIGGGAYTANDVIVAARRLNFAGVNGGNGNGVRITITLQDQYSGAVDSVAGGTNVTFDVYRATFLSGIAAPTISMVSETTV